MPLQIPRLNFMDCLSPHLEARKKFAANFSEGLIEYGFVILMKDGLDRLVSENAYRHVRKFFELPNDVKLEFERREIGRQRGYTPIGKERAKQETTSDLKEFWHTGVEGVANLPQNQWPTMLPDFRKTQLELFGYLHSVGSHLMGALELYLELDENVLKDMIVGGNSVLRSIHYPKPNADDANPIWAAEHEDINLMTLLVEASGAGLQIKTRNGDWLDVDSQPGEIVVDTGDMFQKLTASLFPAVTHRVVAPENCKESRYSLPFFIHPKPDTNLSPLRSPKIAPQPMDSELTAEEYLAKRLRENGVLTVDFEIDDD